MNNRRQQAEYFLRYYKNDPQGTIKLLRHIEGLRAAGLFVSDFAIGLHSAYTALVEAETVIRTVALEEGLLE